LSEAAAVPCPGRPKVSRGQWWLMLVRSYGQDTTLHGLRYIIDPSNLMCRRSVSTSS